MELTIDDILEIEDLHLEAEIEGVQEETIISEIVSEFLDLHPQSCLVIDIS